MREKIVQKQQYDNAELIKKFTILISLIQQRYPPLHILILRSLLQGLSTALGATIGLSLFLALLALVLKNFTGIPFVDWLFHQIQQH